jgi:hypothetical protein
MRIRYANRMLGTRPVTHHVSMREIRVRALFAVMTTATVLALCGCATDVAPRVVDEAVSPSPAAAEETPVAPAPVEVLELSGSRVQALAAGGVVVRSAAFAEGPAAVVDLITSVAGAPEVTEVEETCASAQTFYLWDGMTLSHWAGGDEFVVTAHAPTAEGVAIEITGGHSVGDDVSTALSALPEADVDSLGEGDAYASFDTVSRSVHDTYDSPVGAVGYVVDGTLTSIVTPGEWSSFLC